MALRNCCSDVDLDNQNFSVNVLRGIDWKAHEDLFAFYKPHGGVPAYNSSCSTPSLSIV